MYQFFERPDGSFRVRVDFDRLVAMSDDDVVKFLSVGRYTKGTLALLQRIKEKQELDLLLPPKKRKLSHTY